MRRSRIEVGAEPVSTTATENMPLISRPMRELTGCRPGQLPLEELLNSAEPCVLRGLVSDWGITRAGTRSDHEAMEYIRSFYNGKTISASFGGPEIEGRLFYNGDFTRLNFESKRAQLGEVLDQIQATLNDERPPTIYMGSTLVDGYLPGFRKDNDLGFAVHGIDPPPAIWIGNRTIASCHYDSPNNIACCVVGRRRFTLFPPEQIFNLYPGPFEPTPGGQAISLVNFADPDFEKFPRFREALEAGQVAEVGPGDAVFIPSMWWHHVQGLSPFNTLVNYWWTTLPAYIPTPMNTLYHAIWTLRDRPENEKRAWQRIFDYYVFGPAELAGAHFPEKARGVLGPITDEQARFIRAMLINKLNR
jgi:hypothetical protein